MGVVGRPHGVRGLVHLHSYAADPADLPGYGPLSDDQGRVFRLRWRGEGLAELTQIVDGTRVRVADRAAATRLVNTRLYLDRDRLPAPAEDEFYLADLQGLRAVTRDGREIGAVDAVHDHGGGVYLEIGARLLPFTRACVPAVDVGAGHIVVDLPDEIEVRPDGRAEAAA